VVSVPVLSKHRQLTRPAAEMRVASEQKMPVCVWIEVCVCVCVWIEVCVCVDTGVCVWIEVRVWIQVCVCVDTGLCVCE
jgi:hypothetical protein